MIVENGNNDLRKKMREAHITQVDIAHELGVSAQTVGKWFKEPMNYERRSKVEQVIDRHLESTPNKMLVVYDEGAYPIQHAHAEDAGYDLCIPYDAVLEANKSLTVDTRVRVAVPKGYAGMIKSKSGLNVKHGIRSEGVIDCGFTGTVVVKLYNDSPNDYPFRRGDKITQLVLVKIATPEIKVVTTLDDTERGVGGFGSSGR